jgi:hypothetical protein
VERAVFSECNFVANKNLNCVQTPQEILNKPVEDLQQKDDIEEVEEDDEDDDDDDDDDDESQVTEEIHKEWQAVQELIEMY